jgi:hypothetical protein
MMGGKGGICCAEPATRIQDLITNNVETIPRDKLHKIPQVGFA